MSMQLVDAIKNRDGAAMSRMAGGYYEPEKVINSEAEALVDSLFRQLKQIFPAAISTSLRNEAEEKTTKRQWIVAFAENGIKTREQLSAGVRHARASNSDFWPSPGKFIAWCKDSSVVLGVTLQDAMAEFRRYCRDKDLHDDAESFPWLHQVMYWIIPEARRAMYQRCLSETDVEKLVSKKLNEWAKKVSDGEKIPQPVKTIAYSEPVQTKQPSGDDHKFRYMPNCTMLGSVTPAQWLQREFERRKAVGII